MPERELGRGRTAPFFLGRSFKVRHYPDKTCSPLNRRGIVQLGRPRLMAVTNEGVTTQPLTLTQELILMLLNEETGCCHQVSVY